MIKLLLTAALLTIFHPFAGLADAHSGFPVDITEGPAPQPVNVDGRLRLIYELHLTNIAPIPIEILALEVFSGDGPEALASYRGEALRKLLIPVENILISVNPADSAAKTRAVDGGHSG